ASVAVARRAKSARGLAQTVPLNEPQEGPEVLGWQAVASELWITLTSMSVGIGNGIATFSVPTNPSTRGRSGAIVIAGKAFAVKQKSG
ncbi:MAG TPA: hypothetical protein VFF31_10865, partial [Blastocatellia bacterium]|nr:hypothetical protein [Blastocatellia bacterium]